MRGMASLVGERGAAQGDRHGCLRHQNVIVVTATRGRRGHEQQSDHDTDHRRQPRAWARRAATRGGALAEARGARFVFAHARPRPARRLRAGAARLDRCRRTRRERGARPAAHGTPVRPVRTRSSARPSLRRASGSPRSRRCSASPASDAVGSTPMPTGWSRSMPTPARCRSGTRHTPSLLTSATRTVPCLHVSE
jgi:hypothetical protein